MNKSFRELFVGNDTYYDLPVGHVEQDDELEDDENVPGVCD